MDPADRCKQSQFLRLYVENEEALAFRRDRVRDLKEMPRAKNQIAPAAAE